MARTGAWLQRLLHARQALGARDAGKSSQISLRCEEEGKAADGQKESRKSGEGKRRGKVNASGIACAWMWVAREREGQQMDPLTLLPVWGREERRQTREAEKGKIVFSV